MTDPNNTNWVEGCLWDLLQGGRPLERYVEEFLELSHQVSWPDASLGAVFLLGLDENIIRCSNPACNFTLVELVNLILYLNGSNLEVEEVKENLTRSHTAPSEKHVASPAHSPPVNSTYLSNGSVSSAPPVFP